MIDNRVKVEILIRVALIDNDLATQEISILEDFSHDLEIELDELYDLIEKFKNEENTWKQVKPLLEEIKTLMDRQIIIDSIKSMMEADLIIRNSEQTLLNKVLDLYKID